MNRPSRIVFFDLETGGLEPTRHPIIQIAAVAVDASSLEEIESLNVLLQFSVDDCSPEALEINSYNKERWGEQAVPAGVAQTQFTEMLRRFSTVEQKSKKGNTFCVAQMAGHNIASFDMLFLQHWYKKTGAFLPAFYRPLDTLQRAAWYFQENAVPLPENLKLGTLCAHFGVPIPEGEAHDALADVRGNIALYKAIRSAATVPLEANVT